MTHVHVVPSSDRLELHRLAGCPCGPRTKPIPRDDGTFEIVHLHRSLEDDGTAN
jgi:hypothetical protein